MTCFKDDDKIEATIDLDLATITLTAPTPDGALEMYEFITRQIGSAAGIITTVAPNITMFTSDGTTFPNGSFEVIHRIGRPHVHMIFETRAYTHLFALILSPN